MGFWGDWFSTIRTRLARAIRPVKLSEISCVKKTYPTFRLPDFHRAARAFLQDKKVIDEIRSMHHEDLNYLLANPDVSYNKQQRSINTSPVQLMDVAYRQEESFPEDCFWCFKDPATNTTGILRIKKLPHTETEIELGINQPDQLLNLMDRLIDLSVEHSVYREKFLDVGFEEGIMDEYSGTRKPGQLSVSFRPNKGITEDRIVLADDVKAILDRNVVSFHKNRAKLHELGLPLQRGILLHGPPGTGKTYTCQYLYERLKPVTMIMISGKGLTEVKSVCNLARMLKPSVVVLEDVDLIFTSREINLHSTALGEMMDELDGLQNDDAIIFILTTNAIERLEQAIKDRPGRISQCVFFGPPTRELRTRYLEHFLRDYDCSQLSIDEISALSNGASQAFLQELVYRAVQIGAEQTRSNDSLKLSKTHFQEAMDEMIGQTEKASHAIIGFRT